MIMSNKVETRRQTRYRSHSLGRWVLVDCTRVLQIFSPSYPDGYLINSISVDESRLDGGSSSRCGSVAITSGDTSVVAVQGLLSRAG